MSQAGLIDIESSHPQIPTMITADQGTAVPVANEIVVDGLTVANATYSKPVFTTASGNTLDINVQVGAAITGVPSDTNDAGMVSFDDTMFTVDENGYVQLLGGTIGLDSLTGDDSTVVTGDGAGNINVVGQTVANITNSKALYFTGDAGTNTITGEIQVATALAFVPGTAAFAGICSFDGASFNVDANGHVKLAGEGLAIDSNTGDDGVQVDPEPDGNFNWLGSIVANATHAKPLFFKDSSTPNALDLDLQVAAAVTGAPGDKNDAGIVSLDDTIFSVDVDGYVTLTTTGLATTITGDSGGALSPIANNWNILGGPGVTTSGSGATLTINSVVYTDQGGSTSVTSDSGSFSTAAITLTLPASPANGERCEFIASTSDQLVIQAAGTQVINFGSAASSAGGTATSSAKGDAMQLIYQSSSDDWFALSGVGIWTLA